MKAMKMTRRSLFLFPALLAVTPFTPAQAADSGELLMYIGTYTRGASKGIYAYRFQPKSGKLTPLGLVAETINPSFLAIHPNHKYLYAVSEISDYQGQKSGAVSAFSIDGNTGMLAKLNTVS